MPDQSGIIQTGADRQSLQVWRLFFRTQHTGLGGIAASILPEVWDFREVLPSTTRQQCEMLRGAGNLSATPGTSAPFDKLCRFGVY